MEKKILKALNNEMTREFFSSYLYLSMAAWFEKENLKGFSKREFEKLNLKME